MFNCKIIIFVLSIVFDLSFCEKFVKEKPAYIHTCKLSDPEIDNCLKVQVQNLFIQASQGIPGLKTVPPTDPYFVKRVRFSQQNENLSFSATLRNITIIGLKDTKVESCRVRENGSKWEFKIRFPRVYSTAKYEIDGKVLSLQLKASGSMWTEVLNALVVVNRGQKFYTYQDYAFINFTAISAEVLNVDRIRVNFDNLFGGNKELEQSTNELFNENWNEFYKAFKPLLIGTVEKFVVDITRKIYDYVPAKFLLSDVDNYVK